MFAASQAEAILGTQQPRGRAAAQHRQAVALVGALRQRYAADATTYKARRDALDVAYATTMGNVSRAFPANHHIATFFADALMNTMPWDYYEEGRAALGRTLKPAAAEARRVLERVLAAEPNHEGAIHLYVQTLPRH